MRNVMVVGFAAFALAVGGASAAAAQSAQGNQSSTASAATSAPSGQTGTKQQAKPDQRICKRLPQGKVCMTEKKWKEYEEMM